MSVTLSVQEQDTVLEDTKVALDAILERGLCGCSTCLMHPAMSFILNSDGLTKEQKAYFFVSLHEVLEESAMFRRQQQLAKSFAEMIQQSLGEEESAVVTVETPTTIQ